MALTSLYVVYLLTCQFILTLLYLLPSELLVRRAHVALFLVLLKPLLLVGSERGLGKGITGLLPASSESVTLPLELFLIH